MTNDAPNARAASVEWFETARFGLFMHYGVYSLPGRGEWVQYAEQIPVAEYAKLKEKFTAEKFDADFVAALARDAGMTYVNITSRHHDSFCLFETKRTDFSSVESPAKRDLVAELATACDKKRIKLFLYYSYAADWRHPYFFPRSAGSPLARPEYREEQPEYLWKEDADSQKYLDFVHAQLEELLTQYGPVGGIWFDPIMPFYHRPDLFSPDETYALIRDLQPGCLISFKQGANGNEDYAAPERSAESLAHRLEDPRSLAVATAAWEKNRDKHNEICDTLQPGKWGYVEADDGKHRTPDEVMRMLADADAANCNLLLNTGPLPDGSIHPTDVRTLRKVGERIRVKT